MYVFPIPGINSRACVRGVRGLALLRYSTNFASLVVTIVSTISVIHFGQRMKYDHIPVFPYR